MLRLLLAAVLLLSPSAAFAGGGGGKKEEVAEPFVDLATVGLPVIVDGRAVNYVFVQLRLHVATGQNASELRAKEPYYRDAVIRAAHRQPFVNPKDWAVVDEARLKAVTLAEARRIGGAKAFSSVEIRGATPRRRAGMRPPNG